MRYSQIITDFYKIRLSAQDLALVDAHFVGAAHHRFRAIQTGEEIHCDHYLAHICRLGEIIMEGDFSVAQDTTNRGMDNPDNWNMENKAGNFINIFSLDPLLPAPDMFEDMSEDYRFIPGENHPYDILLYNSGVAVHQITAYLIQSVIPAA